MYEASDLRKGLKIEWEDEPYIITNRLLQAGERSGFVSLSIEEYDIGRDV